MMDNKPCIISVVGTTAIGKTKLSIQLAQYYNAPIISCDSRQFFKEMAIGTAVPNRNELSAAKHYFIQNKSIHEPYSVGDYEKEAKALLKILFKTHKVVILVGGSGLYEKSILEGLDDFPDIAPEIRNRLNTEWVESGIESLQDKLKELDPISYNKIAIDNPHRLIRALEVTIGSGEKYSSFLNKPKNKNDFHFIRIGIQAERKVIYDRINMRVDIMIENGLLEEAKNLHPYRKLNALQTVGYKELFKYFDGVDTLDKAVEEIKKNTRRFAKRQLTWYNKAEDIFWFPFGCEPSIIFNKTDELIRQLE